MNIAHKPTKLLITGKSGSGKTTFFQRYLLASPHAHIWVYDHEGELAIRTGIAPVTTITEDLIQTSPILLYDPSIEFPGQLEQGFDYFCDICFNVGKLLQGLKLFACDEYQKLASTSIISSQLACIIETGRRYEIDTAFCAQQCNLVHNRVRNQLTEVVTFAHSDIRSINFLADIGIPEDSIRALTPLHFLDYVIATGTLTPGQISFEKGLDKVSKGTERNVQTFEQSPNETNGSDVSSEQADLAVDEQGVQSE